jgi:hypothetical protein
VSEIWLGYIFRGTYICKIKSTEYKNKEYGREKIKSEITSKVHSAESSLFAGNNVVVFILWTYRGKCMLSGVFVNWQEQKMMWG